MAEISPFQNIIFLTWFPVSLTDLDIWWWVTNSIAFKFFHRIKLCTILPIWQPTKAFHLKCCPFGNVWQKIFCHSGLES
jgi:hypothetical protein